MKPRLKRLLALALLASPVALLADVRPAFLFQNGAVLQRGKPVPVWGSADAGESVTVTFAGQTRSAVAAADGRWSVTLDPLSASATPATLTIAGKNTVTLSDILVGEVWIASGQSNMEWDINRTYDKTLDVAGSANPLIRHIKIAKKVAESPVSEAAGAWQSASPATTGAFTAVGYHFARDIHAIVGVPVGIINTTWGGTRAEAWASPDTLAAPAFDYVRAEWTKILEAYPAAKTKFDADTAAWTAERDAAKAAGQTFTKQAPRAPQGPGHQNAPAGLYNGMVAPLVPYAIRGAIWYQGESNAGKAHLYHELFSSMITGWRSAFAQGDFPFYWVQLANYNAGNIDGNGWAFLREAQTKTLALPATGQAVIIDIGDVGDIHPRNKKDVGRRLARLALARDYGVNVIDTGPVFDTAERVTLPAAEGETAGKAAYRVTFKSASGLRAPLNTLSGFELAGADQVFKPAQAKLDKGAVLVSSAEVPEPVAVRYAWRNAPVAGLQNDDGLPAVPFRTDDWK